MLEIIGFILVLISGLGLIFTGAITMIACFFMKSRFDFEGLFGLVLTLIGAFMVYYVIVSSVFFTVSFNIH